MRHNIDPEKKRSFVYDLLNQGRKPDGGAALDRQARLKLEMQDVKEPTYEQYQQALEQAAAEQVELSPNLPDAVRKQF